MEIALQVALNTVQIGAVYVLFSLGFTLIFGVMRLINFAHGEFFALAALANAWLVAWVAFQFDLPPTVALLLSTLLAVSAVILLAYLTFRFCFAYVLRDAIGSFIVSLGLVLVLQGVLFETFGGMPLSAPPIVSGNFSIFGAVTSNQKALVCFAALIVAIGVYVFVKNSKIGLALRATAEDHEAAVLQGIPYRRIALWGFLIGSGLAGIAGALLAPTIMVVPTVGGGYLINAFMIVIIGGLGSIPGAIVASFIVAAVESIGGYFWDLSSATIVMFGIVIILLSIRPQGLFGHV